MSVDPFCPTPISEVIHLNANWRNTSNSTAKNQETVGSNIKPSEMECLSLVMASAKIQDMTSGLELRSLPLS